MSSAYWNLLIANIFCAAVILVLWLLADKPSPAQQERAIRKCVFPPSAILALAQKHPELNDAQLERIWAQLRVYFWVCRHFDLKEVTMPSVLVDQAWHAFIVSTRQYTQFCEKAFGTYLHHLPDEDRSEPSKPGLAALGRAVVGARRCASAVGEEESGTLPALFLLDTALKIPTARTFSPEILEKARLQLEKTSSSDPGTGTHDTLGGCSGTSAAACGCGSC